MPPILHFGYFDHAALACGQFCVRSREVDDRLLTTLHELFGTVPGNGMPGIGFFDCYGVLSCERPSVFDTKKLPVSRILELIDQSGCDVVYTYNNQYWLVSRSELPEFLDPIRISAEEVFSQWQQKNSC
jgi:hypothetical protein